MRNRRAKEDAASGHDSFLDIVANIVGILIILVMVVGVRARNAPVQASTETENVEPLVAHNIESGVVLHMHKGGAVRLCWDGLSNCDGVIQELRQAGLSWKSAESESGGKAGESGTRSCPACGANPPTRAHFCHTCGMRLD